MQRSHSIHWGLAVLAAASLAVFTTPASAELKPGDKLDKANCQEPVHVIHLDARYLVVVHYLGAGFGIFFIEVGEGETVPEVRPGLGGGFVHVTVVSHKVLAGVGFRTGFELLAVLKRVVFDLNDFCGVLPVTEFLHDVVR